MASMAQRTRAAQKARPAQRERARRRLTLSVRLSLLALLIALLPLAAVVGVNDYLARGALIQQGRDALSGGASARTQLIDAYFTERLLDGEALASLPTAIDFLQCVDAPEQHPELGCAQNVAAQYGPSVARALVVGIKRNPNYTQWNIYAVNGQFLLSSDLNLQPSAAPTVPPEDLKPVAQGHQQISGVYYNPAAKHAYVRIYTPITAVFGDPTAPVLGFLQATLNLDYVWGIVAGEHSGDGTTAFILDANGVRVADGTSSNLFTTVQPLDAATQGLLSSERRFGTSAPPALVSLPDVQSSLQSTAPTGSFQGVAQPGSGVQYQFVRIHLTTAGTAPVTAPLGWTYFALSPLSTVTSVADNQLRISLISAAVIAVLAILLGLLVGRTTARPVEQSSQNLESAAATLKALASRQQSSAGEQHWVVDACKTGLDSVRYLSDAMNQAARRIVDASNWFNDYWDRLTEDQARLTVQHLQELARYVDEAARRQQASSERLDKAITVTMQVSDQLLTGATEATQSAIQLERVVRDLRHVVGGPQQPASDATEGAELALVPVMNGMNGMAGDMNDMTPDIASPRRSAKLSEKRPMNALDGMNGMNGMAGVNGGYGNPPSQMGGMGMSDMNGGAPDIGMMGYGEMAPSQFPSQYPAQRGGALPAAQGPHPAPPSGRIAPRAPRPQWDGWNPPSQYGPDYAQDDGYGAPARNSGGHSGGRGQSAPDPYQQRPRDDREWR
ncbi:MAG TPA: hypothetical protein VMV29_22115 [Ktedonobacterales bacterium]|nr:hypothetical protein [Ktedonobacterales bacterium]